MGVVPASPSLRVDEEAGASNVGWIAGFLIILAVFAVGGVLWFTFHPM